MSLFGKVLAILNLFGLLGFVYMAAADFQMRHTWAYAVFRWDVALDGIPLDESDTDQQGRPRYVNMTEKLCDELFEDMIDASSIRTQEDFLDRRKQEIDARIDDETVKPAKRAKIIEVLVALATTAGEREEYLAGRIDKRPATDDQLRSHLETVYEKIKEPKESDKDKADSDGKRLAVARALVSMLDLLPTDEEKKKRAEDRAKPAAQQADPAADPVYIRTANALGVRMMSRALDLQAQEYLAMALGVGEVRQQERIAFVYHHQSMLSLLLLREHQLREQIDKLDVVVKQADKQEERAKAQEDLVALKKTELKDAHDVTLKERDRLIAEQEKLHKVRLQLRDANQNNQKMEQAIRKLESELESENP